MDIIDRDFCSYNRMILGQDDIYGWRKRFSGYYIDDIIIKVYLHKYIWTS